MSRMRNRNILGTILLVAIMLGVGGYFSYNYVKQKPPTFLIKLVTKTTPPPPLPLGDIAPLSVPEGFSATIYSRDVPGARVMTRDPRGALLVSLTKSGKVVVLTDDNGDGKAESPVTILENLKQPHGILVHCTSIINAQATAVTPDSCTLYVAETDALKSYDYDAAARTAKYRATLTAFPSGDGHFTRTLLMHPDGTRLLVSIGSSCNVCNEEDEKRASVIAINLETNQETLFAKGLRNTVFMALHPVTGEIWGTENGRDIMEDNLPPDEVNIIQEGKYYGWPLCFGKNVHDTDFDNKKQNPCGTFEPSHIDLQAHSAPLGLAFIPEEGWPEDLAHDLLIAYHGSWDRSVPTGYKVVRFDLNDTGKPNTEIPFDFVTGFLADGAKTKEAIGRPAGLLAEPGGVLYVSDDRAGAIYRVAINKEPR